MGDLQATVEFLVELHKFYNVDLFIRGYYQFRLTFKPPKSSHAIQAEVYEGHGTGGAFSLFPAYVTDDGQTAVSRTFNIYYKDEEVLLKDVFLFRVHLLVDSTKAADCIDKAALEMTVDVHFTDQVVRQNNYQNLPLVTSRTLKFHFSCFNGLHHQIPLLFDYYYFSVLDMIVHANVVSLGLPNWGVLKQIKTGWFSKSSTTPRSSTPLFFTTLFGNRSQLGVQFYSDVSLRYAVTNSNSISRENFQKASAVHRNLCAILAMAHAQLLKYFDEMMQYLDEKQRIKLAEKLDPADLVEGLCKKLETLQSCEEVFDEICSDMSVLNNELALLWLQFQESFALSDQIRPLLRKQHHHERMMHFSEAFFVHELPWKSLLNVTDSSFQKHMNMGQCVKNSRYLSIIPAVTIECAEVDGDNNTTPIFFEDRYVNKKGQSLENVCAIPVHGGIEDDVLEHKPLCFGILNQAFNDLTPQAEDATQLGDLDTKDVWVDIKTSEENDVIAARVAHAGQDTMGDECKVTEKTESCEEGIDISAISPENKADINSATATTQASHGKVDVSTESTDGTTPKTLLKCSMETLQEANDTCKDKSTVQDSQEHCGSMQGTTGREDSDVNNIAGLDTTADEEAMKSKMVSVIEPSTSDGQPASIYDSTIATGSQESRTVNEGDGASPGNHEDCSRTSKDQVQTIDTESLENVLEPKVCLTPANKSQATVLENDNSLQSSNGKEVLVLGEVDSSNFLDSKSGNNVRYSTGEGTVKKTSSVQYVGCSDTVNSSDVVAETKPRTSSKIGQSEPGTVAGVEKMSKDGEADRTQSTGISTGKDEANSTSEFCNSPDATICHINNTEIGDSSAKSSLGTDVTNSSNAPLTDNSFKSGDFTRSAKDNLNRGSKVRNTAQINPGKRVSNSIFYENISFGEDGNKQNEDTPSTRLDTVRLTPNSSTDVIGCFCGGKLAGASSPYRPTSETDASNIMLAKAKQDVLSQMNYCGVLYSDTTTEFLVQPYFMNTKPDLSMEPVHFVVCVHGLDGNSGDLRLLRCFLEMALPSTKFEFLMSEVNQDNTFATFEKQTDKLVSEILHHLEAYRISPTRISFIGHSLGNIIIRSALNHPSLEPYVELFHTLLSLSGPHLGMVHHTSSLVSTGMWLLQKWKKSDSLLQLSLNDSPDMRETFIYKLSKKKGLEYFTNVLLVSSVQDHYAPFHSSRIELPKSLRSNSQEYIVYREMMENLLTPLLSQPNRSLVRYSVYHCLPSSTNTFIGRAAHIAMLDSELFIEKLICTSAAKYFQ